MFNDNILNMCTSLNGFSVNILGNNVTHFKRGEHNYYSLPHLSEYKIKLTNNRPTKCDAEVFIDGYSVGKWRIESFSSIILERPVNLNRKFIFVGERSNIAQEVGIQKYDQNNGLVSVIFKPEIIMSSYSVEQAYISRPTFSCNEGNANYSNQSYLDSSSIGQIENNISFSSGATALGEGTYQYFNTTIPLANIDNNNITTINLRLVIARDPYYVSIKNVMRDNINSIPPRVEDNLIHQISDYIFNSDHPPI